MASLKELRNKINVIESTRKVTEAMKLVAGVKLRKSEQKAIASREYAKELNSMLAKIRRKFIDVESELFNGRKDVKTVLLVVFASDRGLCGNFNYLISKETIRLVHELHAEGKNVRVMCVGNKILELLKKFSESFEKMELIVDFYRLGDVYNNAKTLAEKIVAEFLSNIVDKVIIVSTRYYSAMNHIVEQKEIIPLSCEPNKDKTETIFEPNVVKHIFNGEVKESSAGKGRKRLDATGYHTEVIKNAEGKIISGTKSFPDKNGIYQGQVTVNGVRKRTNNGLSTFFPENWSPQHIINSINHAYTTRKALNASGSICFGTSKEGIKMKMRINPNGKIASVYPIMEES